MKFPPQHCCPKDEFIPRTCSFLRPRHEVSRLPGPLEIPWGSALLDFMAVQFPCHTTHLFKAYNSLVSSVFTKLCNHHNGNSSLHKDSHSSVLSPQPLATVNPFPVSAFASTGHFIQIVRQCVPFCVCHLVLTFQLSHLGHGWVLPNNQLVLGKAMA